MLQWQLGSSVADDELYSENRATPTRASAVFEKSYAKHEEEKWKLSQTKANYHKTLCDNDALFHHKDLVHAGATNTRLFKNLRRTLSDSRSLPVKVPLGQIWALFLGVPFNLFVPSLMLSQFFLDKVSSTLFSIWFTGS